MQQQQSEMALAARGGFLVNLPIQNQEALRRCQDCQSRLLAMVAHDLKSPLNVILGIGDDLRRGIKAQGASLAQQEMAAELDIILDMGNGMLQLIDGLLTSAHMESGKVKLEISEVDDLADLLRTIAGAYRTEAERRHISLRLDLAARLPAVHWDICRIQYHVLNNIFANALKYTGDGGIVELRGRAENDTVSIEIADNGPGIPREERAKVFDRFERLGLKNERVYQGSGLGLYNAHLMASQHGGTIRIGDGIGGRGVSFTVNLPIRAHPGLP